MFEPLLPALIAALAGAVAPHPPMLHRLDGSPLAPAAADSTVVRLMRAGEVPGVSLALLDGGRIAWQRAYGVRDTSGAPLTPASVMQAASFTKAAFACLVLQLVDEGRLDLDAPIARYLPKPLPEYPRYADLAGDPRWRRLTARMLLDHTSGFPNWRWLADDHKLRFQFEPGTRYAYSGEGIALLQLVVGEVTHAPLDSLLEARLFGPLGMTRTTMTWRPDLDAGLVDGFDEYGRRIPHEHWPEADAAGSMQTTPHDFALLLAAVAGGRVGRTARAQMLAPQVRIHSAHQFPTLDTATTHANDAIRLSYGLGWGLYRTRHGEAFFKEGHTDGWENYAVYFVRPRRGLVIMTNSSNGEGIFAGLIAGLLGDASTPIAWEGYTPYDQRPPRPPLPVHHPVAVAADVLARYLGRYGQPPDEILVVRREGDHLAIQENAEPPEELFGESDSAFFSRTSDDVFTFQRDAQGRVVRVVLRTGGRTIPIPRLE